MPIDAHVHVFSEICGSGTEQVQAILPIYEGTGRLVSIHLAQLRIAARMAEATGDARFAAKCSDWIRQGSGVLEEQTWTGSYYLLYNEPHTGEKSDVVMSCQLDGEWVCRFDGLKGVFPEDHVRATLETLKETAVRATKYGAAGAGTGLWRSIRRRGRAPSATLTRA